MASCSRRWRWQLSSISAATLALLLKIMDFSTGWRMARVGDIALLEKPVDDQSPKRIDCYSIDVEDFTGRNGKKFKLDPQRVLFSLRWVHNAIPPDFDLLLYKEPVQWFPAVAPLLLSELNRHDSHLFDELRQIL
jgi:hypothetical protein